MTYTEMKDYESKYGLDDICPNCGAKLIWERNPEDDDIAIEAFSKKPDIMAKAYTVTCDYCEFIVQTKI